MNPHHLSTTDDHAQNGHASQAAEANAAEANAAEANAAEANAAEANAAEADVPVAANLNTAKDGETETAAHDETPASTTQSTLDATAQADDAAANAETSEFGVDAEIDRLGLSHPEIGQTPLLPPREPLGARIASFMGRHHTLLFALSVVILWAITTAPPLWNEEPYGRGEVVTHDILAPHSQMLFDRQETLDRQERAATLVPPSYDPDASAQERALSRLRLLVDTARSAATAAARERAQLQRDLSTTSASKGSLSPRADTTRSDAARATSGRAAQSTLAATTTLEAPAAVVERRVESSVARQLNTIVDEPLAPLTVRQVLSIRRTRWDEIERAAREAIGAVYVGGQLRSDVEDDLVAARARIEASLRPSSSSRGLNEAERALATAFAQRVAQLPNLVVNDLKTERARQAARKSVRRVYLQIRANTPVVRAGELVTDERWAQMQELEIVTPRLDISMALARLTLCILLVSLSAGFLNFFHPRLLHRPTQLWLAAAVPLLFLLAFRYLLRVPHAEAAALPVAATAAMLLTILLDARVGILAGFLVASLCAVMARADLALFLTAALSAWAGTLGVANITSRGQLVRAGLLLTVTNVVLATMLGVFRESPQDEIFSLVLWSAASGVFSTIATAGLAMFLERPFGITTHLRLLELLSPDEVVMRRMQAEAPGTYTHSLMVATLSEAAAKTIEAADPLLCRVGGLYHDIGKLRRPHCFVENQSGENIHDRLSPQLSALVILAHVKDGLELGRALRLPQPVLDIVAQHHGTGLISYFYERAVQQTQHNTVQDSDAVQSTLMPYGRRAGDDTATQNSSAIEHSAMAGLENAATTEGVVPAAALPDESLFRYAGPRPQGKEAAIVLLADSIEASARSLSDPTPERVQAHIQSMIARRLQEGELSDSDLTLRDLQKIESSFAHVLRGVLHHRIEYPDPSRDAPHTLNGDMPRHASKRDAQRQARQNAKRKTREPRLRRQSDRVSARDAATKNDNPGGLQVLGSAQESSLTGADAHSANGHDQNGHDQNGHDQNGRGVATAREAAIGGE